LPVESTDPSETTIAVASMPPTVPGSASTTGPIAPSSLYAAITIATGGSAVAWSPNSSVNARIAALSMTSSST
jgi:hypothetical protein